MNPDTMEDLPDGEQGLLLARGPGVMAGYYNDEGNTHKAFAPGHGWFDTGDLGWRAPGQQPSSNHSMLSCRYSAPPCFGGIANCVRQSWVSTGHVSNATLVLDFIGLLLGLSKSELV